MEIGHKYIVSPTGPPILSLLLNVSQLVLYPSVVLLTAAEKTKHPRELAPCKVDMGWDKLV